MHNLHCRLDDILDNSFLRKDIPTAHTVYGVASTISAAMYAIFISLQKVHVTNQPEVIKLFTEMMLESWRGRGTEIYWRDNYICPSEGEYLKMVERSKYRVKAMIRI